MSLRTPAKISALAVVSVTVCASLALSGCGQRGALYMPGTTPSQSKHAQFIFGSDTKTSTTTTNLAAPKPKSTPNTSGVARPYVPGPVMGVIKDDPIAAPTDSSTITVGPEVGSAS